MFQFCIAEGRNSLWNSIISQLDSGYITGAIPATALLSFLVIGREQYFFLLVLLLSKRNYPERVTSLIHPKRWDTRSTLSSNISREGIMRVVACSVCSIVALVWVLISLGNHWALNVQRVYCWLKRGHPRVRVDDQTGENNNEHIHLHVSVILAFRSELAVLTAASFSSDFRKHYIWYSEGEVVVFTRAEIWRWHDRISLKCGSHGSLESGCTGQEIPQSIFLIYHDHDRTI